MKFTFAKVSKNPSMGHCPKVFESQCGIMYRES